MPKKQSFILSQKLAEFVGVFSADNYQKRRNLKMATDQ